MLSNQKHIRMNELVFTSSLSKGAKLLYGALESLPRHEAHPGQQELDLGLEPPAVGVVAYEAAELASYMNCGIASLRRYTKELLAAGWATWHMGKARGKNRKLVLQLERGLAVESVLPTVKVKNPRSSAKRLKPTQLEAFETTVQPSPLPSLPPRTIEAIPALLEQTAEPKDRDQLLLEMKVATAKVTKRVFAKGMLPLEYVFAPLTLEDLQTLWSSWDAHNPTIGDAGIDQHLQSHLDAVKKSQEPYCEMRAGKMYHLYTGALCLQREMETSAQV